MAEPLILTPTVEVSQLRNGQPVYVATVKEMPGVVTEGESQAAALDELEACVRSIRERLQLPAVKFCDIPAPDWRWTTYSGGKTKTYGPEGVVPDHTRVLSGSAALSGA